MKRRVPFALLTLYSLLVIWATGSSELWWIGVPHGGLFLIGAFGTVFGEAA